MQDHEADDTRGADAVDHLQAAALELIGAARAFLDVVEELVSDRDRMAEATDVVGAAAEAASRAAAGWRRGGEPASQPAEPVEPIPVS